MPAYSKERESEFIALIRAALVQNHNASRREVQEFLENHDEGLHLDIEYIGKLMKKIKVERAHRLDLQTLSEVLSLYQDEANQAKTVLWDFVADNGVEVSDRISAIRQLHDISSTVLDKLFDAGVFERSLGKIKSEGVLNEEQTAEINKALDYVFKYRKDRQDVAASTGPAGTTAPAGGRNEDSSDEHAATQTPGGE